MCLQGSYLRGEASEHSDIDVMVLLEELTIPKMDLYRQILMEAGQYERSCGFISGRAEFQNWNTLELCHVQHTTKDYFGKLSDFVQPYSQEDVRQYTIQSLNNLYHALCHTYIHRGAEKTLAHLPGMYKSAFFILQSAHFLESGNYIQTKAEILRTLQGTDRQIMERCHALAHGGECQYEDIALLFTWCREKMCSL